jgi:hypothetical protein
VRRLALAALLPAAALAASGCASAPTSDAKFEGQQGDVAQVVTDLSAAAQRKDAQKICTDLLTRQLQQRARAQASDCQAEIRKATDDADEFAFTVQSVQVTGSRAQATVRQGDDGPVTRMSFTRENGSWRIAGLGG